MNSPLNKWLDQQESRVVVPRGHRRLVAGRVMPGAASVWLWPRWSLFVPAMALAVLVVFFTSSSPSSLTPESVLAQVQASDSLTRGQVEVLTLTKVAPNGEEQARKIYTNGQWFYDESLGSWVEKNNDNLTLTWYETYSNYGQPDIRRSLVGDMAHYSDRSDIDGWREDPLREALGLLSDSESSIAFVPCEGCDALELPVYFAGGDLTLTLGTEAGEEYYYVTTEPLPFPVLMSDQSADKSLVTRTAKIRARDYQLVELSSVISVPSGDKLTSATRYTYEWVDEDKLSIPTSLAEWFAVVDPNGRAEMSCHVYSSGQCNGGVLQQSLSDAPPYYIPAGWLDFERTTPER